MDTPYGTVLTVAFSSVVIEVYDTLFWTNKILTLSLGCGLRLGVLQRLLRAGLCSAPFAERAFPSTTSLDISRSLNEKERGTILVKGYITQQLTLCASCWAASKVWRQLYSIRVLLQRIHEGGLARYDQPFAAQVQTNNTVDTREHVPKHHFCMLHTSHQTAHCVSWQFSSRNCCACLIQCSSSNLGHLFASWPSRHAVTPVP